MPPRRRNKVAKAVRPPVQRPAPQRALVPAAGRNPANRARAVNMGRRGPMAKPVSHTPYQLLSSALTQSELSIAQYLHGLSTPGYPCKVPMLMGQFALGTNTYEYVFNGTTTATSAANNPTWVAGVLDAWAPGNNMIGYTTQGNPVWNAKGAAATTPAFGAAASADYNATAIGALDARFDAGISYRMTALILEAWSDAPAQTAQGDICFAMVASADAAADKALNGVNFATVTAYEQDYVAHAEFPLAGWKSGHVGHTFVVPSTATDVDFNTLPSAGSTVCGAIGVLAITSGMASGQTIRYRITMKYEVTRVQSYQTNILYEETTPVSMEEVQPYLNAHRTRPTYAPAGYDRFKAPATVLTVNDGNSRILKGFKQAADAAKSAGITDIIGSGLKEGANWVLGKVPYIGSALQAGFNALFG